MCSLVQSQWLRTKRTPVRIVVMACPVIYVLLFSSYCMTSSYLQGKELSSFFFLFSMLAGFALSFFVPMIYAPDREACLFANELRIGVSRGKIFISKFLLTSILLGMIEGIAAILFSLFLLVIKGQADLLQLGILMAIPFVTLLPMIVIYQFLALQLGYAGSIVIGSFLTLASILLGTTGLGGCIWRWFPFTWNVRLIYDYMEMIDKVGFINELTLKLIESVFITLLLLCICILWYNRWDGITKMEE